MNLRRWIWLTWLAVVLNALSPVLAHGRGMQHGAPDGQGKLVLALCGTNGAQGITLDLSSGSPKTQTHFVIPHCVYCPGFAGNFALGRIALTIPPATVVALVQPVAPRLPTLGPQPRQTPPSRGPPASA